MPVAIVGLGPRGMAYLHTLLDLGAGPVVVADHHPDRRFAALAAGASAGFADTAELLAREQPGLMVVATPPTDHLDTALVAAAAGVPLLVEKPVVTVPKDAGPLLAHTIGGGFVSVGHSERWNPAVAAVRSALQEGAIGSVVSARFCRIGPRRTTSVTVDLDLAVHDLDLARWLFNGLQITERRADRESDPSVVVLEGTSFAGSSIVVEARWSADRRRDLLIEGTEGRIHADLLTHTAEIHRASGRTNLIVRPQEPLRAMIADVIEAIEQQADPPVSLADGLATVTLAVGTD